MKFEIFGTSHSRYIGCCVYGITPGYVIDIDLIKTNLQKRSSFFVFNTSRVEEDKVIFIDGVADNVICKDKFSFVIENKNVRSKDYLKGIIRPSHADYIGYMLEGEDYDYSGGGVFSGRMTSLYVVLGSIIESNSNIGMVNSHISKVLDLEDDKIRDKCISDLNNLDPMFPVFNDVIKDKMISCIKKVASDKNSIGGELTFRIDGIDFGYGGYGLDCFESVLSKYIFSIGAIKGITFGMGREYLDVLGSDANDSYYLKDGLIISKNNKQGGINGGFTNGFESVIFSVIIRPTPSIFFKQDTVKYVDNEFSEISYMLEGRHDSFIVNRINQVIKSVVYIALYEMEGCKYEKNRT